MTSRSLPTCVKVFGILHIIFGTIGLLYSFAVFSTLQASIQAVEVAGINTLFITYLQVAFCCNFLGSLVTLYLGISLLIRRAWARFSTVIFAYIYLGWLALSTVLSITMSASMYSSLQQNIGDIGSDPQFATSINYALRAQNISIIIGGLVIAIYPILTIIFLSKVNVKAAFNELPRL